MVLEFELRAAYMLIKLATRATPTAQGQDLNQWYFLHSILGLLPNPLKVHQPTNRTKHFSKFRGGSASQNSSQEGFKHKWKMSASRWARHSGVWKTPQSPELGVPVGISCVSLQSEAKASLCMLLRGLYKLGVTGELQRGTVLSERDGKDWSCESEAYWRSISLGWAQVNHSELYKWEQACSFSSVLTPPFWSSFLSASDWNPKQAIGSLPLHRR